MIKPRPLRVPGPADERILAVEVRFELISEIIQIVTETVPSLSVTERFPDGFSHHGVFRLPAGLDRAVNTSRRFGTGILHDGQFILSAKFIRHSAEPCVFAHAAVVFLSVAVGYGIDDEMVVQMMAVHVRGDKHLESVSPQTLCQFDSDPVALLGRDLARLETLVGVVGDVASRLAESALDGLHILRRVVRLTMKSRNEIRLFVSRLLRI